MSRNFSWQTALEGSPQSHWQVADLVGGDRQPDFAYPFLPEPFARTLPLGFLDVEERRILSQIRGRGYMHLCGVFDGLILPFVIDNARGLLNSDGWRVRALLQFAARRPSTSSCSSTTARHSMPASAARAGRSGRPSASPAPCWRMTRSRSRCSC